MIAYLAPLLAPSQSPKPAVTPSCLKASGICEYLYGLTGQKWLAESSYWILVKPLRILLIVAVALIARFVIHRAISRVIQHTEDRYPVPLPKPLRERMPEAIRAATFLPEVVVGSERRRQRARALGSVLRSIASTVIVAIAVMLILDELSVNLAPILASAGIVGLAVGFGAQNLVKDFLAGMFILMEDQFGVGDIVELGQLAGVLNGTVEAVGLRITTLRDERGAMWYIRNGEIIRVGNKSQGAALAIVDIPVKPIHSAEATAVLSTAAEEFKSDPEWTELLTGAVEVLGVEEVTSDTMTLRTTAKTTIEAQARVGRELRLRMMTALQDAGLTSDSTPSPEPGAAGTGTGDQ